MKIIQIFFDCEHRKIFQQNYAKGQTQIIPTLTNQLQRILHNSEKTLYQLHSVCKIDTNTKHAYSITVASNLLLGLNPSQMHCSLHSVQLHVHQTEQVHKIFGNRKV